MIVRWSDTALIEALRIFLYIARENPSAAEAVRDAMRATADSLTVFPKRHRDRGLGRRRVPIAHYDYYLCYRVRRGPEGPFVSIETVRHVARRPRRPGPT